MSKMISSNNNNRDAWAIFNDHRLHLTFTKICDGNYNAYSHIFSSLAIIAGSINHTVRKSTGDSPMRWIICYVTIPELNTNTIQPWALHKRVDHKHTYPIQELRCSSSKVAIVCLFLYVAVCFIYFYFWNEPTFRHVLFNWKSNRLEVSKVSKLFTRVSLFEKFCGTIRTSHSYASRVGHFVKIMSSRSLLHSVGKKYIM